jgi:hypothetical protein
LIPEVFEDEDQNRFWELVEEHNGAGAGAGAGAGVVVLRAVLTPMLALLAVA